MAQRLRLALNNQVSQISLGIAYAKIRGATVDEYAAYCGDQFAAGWNTQRGFTGFVAGVLSNYDLCRAEGDAPIEILEQSDATLRIRAYVRPLAYLRSRKSYRVTTDELTRWWDLVWQRIAVAHGCEYSQQVDGDFVIVTVTKAQSGPVRAAAIR